MHETVGLPLWFIRRMHSAQVRTVSDLAKRAGVSRPYIYTIINGTTLNPGVEKVRRLAHAVGMSTTDLLQAIYTEENTDARATTKKVEDFGQEAGTAVVTDS